MMAEELMASTFDRDARRRYSSQNLFVTVVAIVLFVFCSFVLCRSFFLTDPLKAAEKGIGILWATMVFLVIYSFSTAGLMAKLWLEHKKMQLYAGTSKSDNSEDQEELTG